MGKEDEVLPDSQDEGKIDTLDLLGRDFSPLHEQHPLTNASIPSLGTSSSFVFPQPTPPNRTSPSTISQYTADIVLNAVPDCTSAISAFTTSSSVNPSAKPRPKKRPKPKPNYEGTVEANDPDTNGLVNQRTQVLPSPENTFTADISERIKARRALGKQRGKNIEHKAHGGSRKSPLAVEDVIDVDSEGVPTSSGPSPLPSLPNRPDKHTSKSQYTVPVNVDAPAFGPSHSPDEVEAGRDTSHAYTRKRKCDPPLDNDSSMLPVSVAVEISDNSLGSGSVQDGVPPPKKKRKQKIIDGGKDEPGVSGKANKKKRKDKDQQPKKRQEKSSGKGQEKDQFKSSEFILDSDDDVTLGNREGTSVGVVVTAAESPVTVPVPSSPLSESPMSFAEAQGKSMQGPIRGSDLSPGSGQSVKERPKKVANRKRKSKAESHKEATMTAVEGQPPSKKARNSEDTPESQSIMEKPRVTLSIGSETHATTEPAEPWPSMSENDNDLLKRKRKKGGRKVIEADEDEGGGKENTTTLTKPLSTITPVRDTKAPPQKPNTSKPSYAHPPKNRPLSAILQLVNGSSPRPRASPSISRSLLTRIVPLHQNRRTPPPPPLPRIIPKKTKKELEREEKWEEELQETVEGWCELEEAERERMRRAKRDWELGLYEE
ncbi:hypothetical protein JB92DRAFT_2860158 [Gautieria morchelliformis]|nr:hypothetical protein JB92DRAFT_2860158 [Gautieria morchelliformis]